MVPLSTSVTFGLYNCIMIYNYSFQVISSLNSFKFEKLCYLGIYFKICANVFKAQLVDTAWCLYDSNPLSFVITIKLSKRLQNMWFCQKTLILITLNQSLVRIQKFNLNFESNGIVVQLYINWYDFWTIYLFAKDSCWIELEETVLIVLVSFKLVF